MCELSINVGWDACLLLQFRWSRGAVISLWLLGVMWVQQGLREGKRCHCDWSIWLQRTPAATAAWLGDQMESDPAISARLGEGRDAVVLPPRILNHLLLRRISHSHLLFFWRIALGHQRALPVSRGAENLLFSCSLLWRWLQDRLVQRRQWETRIQNSHLADFPLEIARGVRNNWYDQEGRI